MPSDLTQKTEEVLFLSDHKNVNGFFLEGQRIHHTKRRNSS